MHASILDVCSLRPPLLAQMFDLFAAYYEDIDFATFANDLGKKQRVVLLRSGGAVVGFTTIGTFGFSHLELEYRIVFSGDTIVRRDFWGNQSLSLSWLREIGRMARETPEIPLYWLLIVKGHRTYRYLPTFGREFMPHWSIEAPEHLRELRDAVAGEMFGDDYNFDTGVVSFREPRGKLRQEWALPSDRERRRPEVDFFLRSNPGYGRGDELVCLCSLSPDNMHPYARRLFEQGFGG